MFKYEKIELRKLCKGDLSDLKSLKDESWFGTHSVSIVNNCDQHRWFEAMDTNVVNPKSLMMIATHRPLQGYSDEHQRPLVGGSSSQPSIGIFKITSIEWINRTADVAWDLYKEYRGKGLGKPLVKAGVEFCFSILNLRRLDAEILETNIASQKCAEAAGFALEGTRRQAVHCRGKEDRYVDSHFYGCLRI